MPKQIQIKTLILLSLLFIEALEYINPVQGASNSPDPGVVYDGHYFYAATTGGSGPNYMSIWQSIDLYSWTHKGFILNSRPSWAVQNFWAPEIHIINHMYMAYYSARDSTGYMNIGVAFSDRPTGPYIDKGTPLLRIPNKTLIDPNIYKFANGTVYLIYKVHDRSTQIYAVQLTPDGKQINGQHHLLFSRNLTWQHGIVQAPWMIYENQTYYIFYSGCGFDNKCYAVGVVRSKNFFGPYQKHLTPILSTRQPETSQSWEGPGHCSVVKTLKGNYAMVYHAWPNGKVGTNRYLLVDKVTFENGWPKVRDGYPSETQQPNF